MARGRGVPRGEAPRRGCVGRGRREPCTGSRSRGRDAHDAIAQIQQAEAAGVEAAWTTMGGAGRRRRAPGVPRRRSCRPSASSSAPRFCRRGRSSRSSFAQEAMALEQARAGPLPPRSRADDRVLRRALVRPRVPQAADAAPRVPARDPHAACRGQRRLPRASTSGRGRDSGHTRRCRSWPRRCARGRTSSAARPPTARSPG